MSNKLTSVITALLILAAAALGGLYLVHQEQPGIAFGAASGPDQVGSDHYSWNGIVIYPSRAKAANATTTLCAFKSPAATTTLTKFSVNFPTSISTTSAPTVYLAKAATAFATTTNLATIAFAQNAAGNVVATSTIQATGANVIAPSQYLVVAVAGQSAFYDPLATCQVEFTGL